MKALHLLRTCLICWEVLAVVALVVLFRFWPSPFYRVDAALTRLGSTVVLVPCGPLVAFSILSAGRILFPKNHSRALTRFPKYPLLRITTVVGVIYVAIGIGAVALAMGLRGQVPPGIVGLLATCGYAVALISTLEMVIAALVIRSLVMGGE